MSISLTAIIVGGMGTMLGSILGATFITMVPEALKLIVGWLPISADATLILAGAHHCFRSAHYRLPYL